MDVYKGIQSDIVSSNRFDENSDISTAYLGKVESKGSQDKLRAEESFPISESGYTLGRLLEVGNGQCVSVLFIIPVIVDIHGHRFKIYTLVSEIHENVDLVLGIKMSLS